MLLANISNGLAYDHENVCYFQSQHGHSMKAGYFRIDAMPYNAVIKLLKGEKVTIVDATAKIKKFTDAMKFGIPTWCLVFNRAIGLFNKEYRNFKVCDWQTPEMLAVSKSKTHKSLVNSIRKLAKIYGYSQPAVIGENILLQCYQRFPLDDKPYKLKALIKKEV